MNTLNEKRRNDLKKSGLTDETIDTAGLNVLDEVTNRTKDAVNVIAVAAHLPADHPVHLLGKGGFLEEAEANTLMAALEQDGFRIERAVRKTLPNRKAQRVLEVFHDAVIDLFFRMVMKAQESSANQKQDELEDDQERIVYVDDENLLVIHPGSGSSPGSRRSGASPGSAASSASPPSPPSRPAGTSARSGMSSTSATSAPSVLGISAAVAEG